MLHMFRIRFHRKQQQETGMAENQIKTFNIACIRNHISVKIIFEISDAVNVDSGSQPIMKQLLLIMHPMLSKELHCVICIDTPLFHRNRRIPKLLHMRLHFRKQLLVHRNIPDKLSINTVSKRKIDLDLLDPLPRDHLIKRLQHQKDRTALVRLITCVILRCDKRNLRISRQSLFKLPELSIDPHKQDIILILILKISRDLQIGCSLRIRSFDSVHLHNCHKTTFHNLSADDIHNISNTHVISISSTGQPPIPGACFSGDWLPLSSQVNALAASPSKNLP